MSLRLEMLQVARLAPKLLGDSSKLVEDFIISHLDQGGGFKDRAGDVDLYYTVFGIEGLLALQTEPFPPNTLQYLYSLDSGADLDFVHLACLARAWAGIPDGSPDPDISQGILSRIESFRTADGGYHPTLRAKSGTVYACFLALGAYQDLDGEMPNQKGMLNCLNLLRAKGGGYANESNMAVGLTSSTAAAAALLRHLGQKVPPELADWLLQRSHPQGGFVATPLVPAPDLLSTATALHALAGMQASLAEIKEPCLDFIDSLWVNKGGFFGSWSDETLDIEYTYYGLLALGHLSLW